MERLLDVRHFARSAITNSRTSIMLQDEGGRVFGVSDDTTSFLGESGEEAIENILSLREPQIDSIGGHRVRQARTRPGHRAEARR